MKNYNRILFLFLLVFPLFAFVSNVNDWKDITAAQYESALDKTVNHLKGNVPFSVDIEINAFKTHKSETPYEVQRGYYIRSGNYYHTFLLGLHSYQNKKYRFIIDSTDQTIMIADVETEKEHEMLLNTYSTVKSGIVSYKMASYEKTNILRVEFSPKMKLAYCEMEIDKTGIPVKSTTYMRVQLSEKPDDPAQAKTSPRLETTFFNFKQNVKLNYDKEFSEDRFFVFSEGKFKGVGKYKDYIVHDTRIKTN